MIRVETKHLFREGVSPQIKSLILKRRAGIPLNEHEQHRLKTFNESVSMVSPTALHNRIVKPPQPTEEPKTFDELEELPGVGHKTASVVMSQAFGFPSFPVDTHIHRLAQRWKLTNGKSVTQTEKDLKKLFPKERWNDIHLQIIFYGREHCQARKCFGIECKICKTLFPDRKKKVLTKKA